MNFDSDTLASVMLTCNIDLYKRIWEQLKPIRRVLGIEDSTPDARKRLTQYIAKCDAESVLKFMDRETRESVFAFTLSPVARCDEIF